MPYTLNPSQERFLVEHGSTRFVVAFRSIPAERQRQYAERVRLEFRQSPDGSTTFMPVRAQVYDEGVELLRRYCVGVFQPNGAPFSQDLDDILSQLLAPAATSIVVQLTRQLFAVSSIERDPEGDESKQVEEQLTHARGLLTDPSAEDSAESAIVPFDLFAAKDAGVALAIERWDSETSSLVEYHLDVKLKAATSAQMLRYDNARQLVQRAKKHGGAMFQREDTQTVQRLFEERIQSISNAQWLAGDELRPCDGSSVAEWAGLVPYAIVSAAMSLDSQRLAEGNG